MNIWQNQKERFAILTFREKKGHFMLAQNCQTNISIFCSLISLNPDP